MQIITALMSVTTTSGATVANSFYDFISQYDNRFSHVTDTDIITYRNSANIKFSKGINGRFVINSLDSSDVVTGTSEFNTGATSYSAMLMLSDSFFYLLCKDSSTTNIRGGFYFLDVSPNIYFGGWGYNGSYSNINGATFVDSANHNSYTFTKLFDFSVLSPKIMFSTTSVIKDNSNNTIVVPQCCSCSTVTTASTITVNNHNYFALGTNTLIQVS